MKTMKVLMEEKRKELDEAWKKKYPIGRFFIYRSRDGATLKGIGFLWERTTSHTMAAISVPKNIWPSSMCGRVLYYSTWEKFEAACNRMGVPQADVDTIRTKNNERYDK